MYDLYLLRYEFVFLKIHFIIVKGLIKYGIAFLLTLKLNKKVLKYHFMKFIDINNKTFKILEFIKYIYKV
jgi:hypothetical protein